MTRRQGLALGILAVSATLANLIDLGRLPADLMLVTGATLGAPPGILSPLVWPLCLPGLLLWLLTSRRQVGWVGLLVLAHGIAGLILLLAAVALGRWFLPRR